MNLNIIKNYLMIMGKSYYKSTDLHDLLKDLGTSPDFIAEFGLGIFSYFLLAKSFTIYTRHRENESDTSSNPWYKIEFTRGFCLIEKTTKPDIGYDFGTVVQIEVNQDMINMLTQYFKYQIHFDIVRPRISINCRVSDSSKPVGLFDFSGERRSNEVSFEVNKQWQVVEIQGYCDQKIFCSFQTIPPSPPEEEISGVSVQRKFPDIAINGIRVISNDPIPQCQDHLGIPTAGAVCSLLVHMNMINYRGDLKSNIVCDLPSEVVKPTLSRNQIQDECNAYTFVVDCVETVAKNALPPLKERMGPVRFWNVLNGFRENYEALKYAISIFGVEEAVQSTYIQVGNTLVPISQFPEETQKTIDITTVLLEIISSLPLKQPSYEVSLWPRMNIQFLISYVFPYLIDNDWNFEITDTPFAFNSHLDWDIFLSFYESFPEPIQNRMVVYIGKYCSDIEFSYFLIRIAKPRKVD
ncbi:MAG: hypothetical protein E3J86_11680 [Candidatus Thorarchaeota archaeon]|nr:MAG: hypothetical protein E3J86_11680 [Candidatus Thorarchaeota archaeon]